MDGIMGTLSSLLGGVDLEEIKAMFIELINTLKWVLTFAEI